MTEKKKLSPHCIGCGCLHLESWMNWWLELCKRKGVDPLDAKHGGIYCELCFLRSLKEMSEDHPEILGKLSKPVREMLGRPDIYLKGKGPK